jgi:hypothetical protein
MQESAARGPGVEVGVRRDRTPTSSTPATPNVTPNSAEDDRQSFAAPRFLTLGA